MKKVSKIIVLCLLITLTLSTMHFISKKDSKILENKKEESSFLTYMLETDVGSNKYEAKTNIDFPLEGYHINISESGCENGGTLSWNSEKGKIEANLLTSDKCYVYLDNVQVKNEFNYTGNYEEYIVPSTGTYKIELWGASGADFKGYKGGRGGYVKGNINLKKGEILYIYVGNTSDKMNVSGFNGGSAPIDEYGGAGGGATDVRLKNGDWNNFDSLKSRIIVAAGGGGANNRNFHVEAGETDIAGNYYFGAGNGGYAGGLEGGDGEFPDETHTNPKNGMSYGWFIAKGAKQNAGGIYEIHTSRSGYLGNGNFGYASPAQSCGGSGYYAGASVSHGGGAGGSSFISGYPGCDAIDEKSTENEIIHTGEPNHYSGKVFTDSEMIAGNTTMPSPDGGTEVGHTGSGYAKITLVK